MTLILAEATEAFVAEGRYDMLTNLEYLATGFIIVIGALSILWGACTLVGTFFARKAKAAAKAKAATAVPVASGSEEDDPAIIAVIAAAIQVTLHRPMRIRSVRTVHTTGANESRHHAWALEGRSSHFQSHKVR